jgi:hypothetical protein
MLFVQFYLVNIVIVLFIKSPLRKRVCLNKDFTYLLNYLSICQFEACVLFQVPLCDYSIVLFRHRVQQLEIFH